MTPIQMLMIAIACLMIGLSKGGLGGPLPVSMVTPLLALVMDAREAVVLVLPFLIFADIFALRAYWMLWDTRLLLFMLPPAVVGVIAGGISLSIIPDNDLKIIIGIATLMVIGYKLSADYFESIDYTSQNWHSLIAGTASGFGAALANAGAPPFTVYMLLRKVESIPFIGTATLFFAVVNLLKIPIFLQQDLIQLDSFLSVIWALPIVPLGVYLGRRALDYISQIMFERIMLILLFVTVILLFVTSLSLATP
jgi:hypothetical protein